MSLRCVEGDPKMLEIEDKRNDLTAAGMLRAIRFRVERALQRGEQLDQQIQQRLLSAKLSLTERLKLERASSCTDRRAAHHGYLR